MLVLIIGLSTHCCVHFGCCGASNDAIKERIDSPEERKGKKRRSSRRDEVNSGDGGRRSSVKDRVRETRQDRESMER